MSILKRSATLGVLILVSLVVSVSSLESSATDASIASNSQGTLPLTLPLKQVAPGQASVIQYTAIGTQPSQRFSHLQLRLGADGKPTGGPTSLQLPTDLGFVPDFAWPSPTGDYAVLMRPVEPGGIPYVWNRRTGKTVSVLSQYGGGSFFGWHPDGRRFLLWIDSVGFWLIDAETQAKAMLANPNGPVQGAAISRDGKTIAYVAYNLRKAPDEIQYALWFVSSTGGDAKPQVDVGGVSYLYPHSWSPDGNRLIYYGSCAPRVGKGTPPAGGPLCILDLRTRVLGPLRIPYAGYEPNWSPDGRYVAATGFAPNGPSCTKSERLQDASDTCLYKGKSAFIADTKTGQMEEIGAGIAPVWSPDGSMIAFLSKRGSTPDVWVYNRAKHESTQLTNDGQNKVGHGNLMWRLEVKK